MHKMKVAAVQMRAELGNVKSNLSTAEALVREAFRKGAKWVILPEFFPSAVAFAPNMLTAWRPLEGEPFQLMQKLAREYEGVIGGSFIAKSGDDCLNSFLLVFPSGEYFRHDKDIPTMWENCYYIGGQDDGVLKTPTGPVGVAVCWELIRSQTARRLQNRVDLIVGGSCWWDVRLPADAKYEADRARLHNFLKIAPSRLARMAGAPGIHASHAGDFEGLIPGDESRKYRSRYLGETQIVDGTGQVLSHMTYDDGEGIAFADLELGRVRQQNQFLRPSGSSRSRRTPPKLGKRSPHSVRITTALSSNRLSYKSLPSETVSQQRTKRKHDRKNREPNELPPWMSAKGQSRRFDDVYVYVTSAFPPIAAL